MKIYVNILLLFCLFINTALAIDSPTLPQVYIDTTYSLPTGGTTHTCATAAEFSTALTNSALGDVIVLTAGTTYAGPFVLPNKSTGSGWIYIISSALASLPASGTRVAISDASNMPKITVATGGRSAIETANNAHHFRFVGIEFKPVANNFVYSLIRIGNADVSESTLPSNITFDRCYIHGDSTVGGRRGVAMDGTSIAVVDSYVSDFKEVGADTQALWAYNTPGPLKIVNNYLEAAGENVMFGGNDPSINNCVPSDIEIRRNHFFKPLSWVGSSWSVKNILEFKNAQRVLVEGNTFENNWAASQNGFSILITPRNQDGDCEWCGVADITYRYNKLINGERGINILGRDYTYTSQVLARVNIHDNLFQVTVGAGLQYLGGPTHISMNHNTFYTSGTIAVVESSPKADYCDFINNIFIATSYGFIGSGTGEGTATLNTYFTNYTYAKNAMVGRNCVSYPADNYCPATVAAVGFVDYAGGNYRLASDSTYKNAGTDGADLGANIDLIDAAMAYSNNYYSITPRLVRGVTVRSGASIK